jgi:hypothetical protein
MLATATHPTEPDTEEHLQRRLIQLANLVVHCDFTAPEFRRAGSSQHVLTPCGSKPNIHAQVGHDSGPTHTAQVGTVVLELTTTSPERIQLVQDLVRAFEPSPLNTQVANSTTLTANKESGYGRRQVV